MRILFLLDVSVSFRSIM